MMMTDEQELRMLLKAALPPVRQTPPSRDLWPLVVERTSAAPTWTPADVSAAAIIVGALLLFPKWFWFLAYHL
jgi:hypothetical protein